METSYEGDDTTEVMPNVETDILNRYFCTDISGEEQKTLVQRSSLLLQLEFDIVIEALHAKNSGDRDASNELLHAADTLRAHRIDACGPAWVVDNVQAALVKHERHTRITAKMKVVTREEVPHV